MMSIHEDSMLQTLGQALGYPSIYVARTHDGFMIVDQSYPDAIKVDSIYVGDATIEDLVTQAAETIQRLKPPVKLSADTVNGVPILLYANNPDEALIFIRWLESVMK